MQIIYDDNNCVDRFEFSTKKKLCKIRYRYNQFDAIFKMSIICSGYFWHLIIMSRNLDTCFFQNSFSCFEFCKFINSISSICSSDFSSSRCQQRETSRKGADVEKRRKIFIAQINGEYKNIMVHRAQFQADNVSACFPGNALHIPTKDAGNSKFAFRFNSDAKRIRLVFDFTYRISYFRINIVLGFNLWSHVKILIGNVARLCLLDRMSALRMLKMRHRTIKVLFNMLKV